MVAAPADRTDDVDEPILKSLMIDTDLGGVDLLLDIERIFKITFENAEAEEMVTVGDLYSAILKRFPEPSKQRKICLTAVMFYRLRRQLAAIHPTKQIGPDTRLESLFESMPLRKTWQRLEDSLSLGLPPLRVGWTPVGPLLSLCLRTSAPLSLLWGALLLPAVVAALPSFLLTAPFIRRLPTEFETVGDLTREMAYLHFRELSEQYNSYRLGDIWGTFEKILRVHSPVTGRIGLQTEIIGEN